MSKRTIRVGIYGLLAVGLVAGFFAVKKGGLQPDGRIIALHGLSCWAPNIVRVRVGDLHFELPKERQLKLASTLQQLDFLSIYHRLIAPRPIVHKLADDVAVSPADIYCQEEGSGPVDVYGFGLVLDWRNNVMDGSKGVLKDSLKAGRVHKIEGLSEARRNNLALMSRAKLSLSSPEKSQLWVSPFAIPEKMGRREVPIKQFWVLLKGDTRREFYVDCKKGSFFGCTFDTQLNESVVLTGRLKSDKLFQQVVKGYGSIETSTGAENVSRPELLHMVELIEEWVQHLQVN